MSKKLNEIEELLKRKDKINKEEFRAKLKDFLRKNVQKNQIDNYIGDYPSIIEPVVLGQNVTIGDDVLLGPNVFIGDNTVIGNYNEISNSVICDNVNLGDIFKFDFCFVDKGSNFSFNSLNLKNCILNGNASSKKELNKKCFE